MNPLLFGLISKAGSASLGELQARSSLPASTLANEIKEMVLNGDVILSIMAGYKPKKAAHTEIATFEGVTNPAFMQIIDMMNTPKGLVDLAKTNSKTFVDGIQFALKDDTTGRSINVSPTARGFRSVV